MLGVAGSTGALAADGSTGAHAVDGSTGAHAADGSTGAHGAGGWTFAPSVHVKETVTDNVDQSPDSSKRGDFITEIVPAIRIDGSGKRIKLHLDYQMDNVIYVRNSSQNTIRNTLNARGSVEAVENFFFVDGTATIAQEALSAFGPRPTDNTTISRNRTETRTWEVSPFIRGQLAGTTDYLVRYTYTDLTSTSDSASDSRVSEVAAHIGGPTRKTDLAWATEFKGEQVDSARQRDTQEGRARAILTYTLDPQFRISGSGGYERNNFVTLETTGNTTYGVGFEWAPTPRTNVFGHWERRFFGTGWDYGARHRSPYFSFSLSSKRDVNTDAQRAASTGSGAAYNLLFAALATRIPDPIDRAAEAQRLLQDGGIPADLGLPPDFLVGTPFVESRTEAAAAFLGVRNTITFRVYQTTRDALGVGAELGGPSTIQPNTSEWGSSAAYSHRVTGLSSLSAIGSWRRTTGKSTTNLASDQWDTRLQYVTQLGRRTFGSLEVRHTDFTNNNVSASDYRENAFVASLLMQF